MFSLDEFCASKQFRPDYVPEGADSQGPCMVYPGGAFIELVQPVVGVSGPHKPYCLTIGNLIYRSYHLERLEGILYEYMRRNGWI